MHHDFEDIEVKLNAPKALEDVLRRKRKKCMIGTGAMSDPYIHLEEKLGNSRKCIELIHSYGFGLDIQTKSNRIVMDLSDNESCFNYLHKFDARNEHEQLMLPSALASGLSLYSSV